MRSIDLNADLGEGEPYDGELLAVVSSCNIACGGHAGDDDSMQRTVAMAIEHGVAIGAHPSYPDQEGFGRRTRFLGGDELRASLCQQIKSLVTVVERNGAELSHVKPHGALYNDAAHDAALAEIVVRATAKGSPGAALIGPPNSALSISAARVGMRFVSEAFVDRAYQRDGSLVARSVAGAVFESVQSVVAQAVSLLANNEVRTADGDVVAVVADTLCIHGDTPVALQAAVAVRAALELQGVDIRAIVR